MNNACTIPFTTMLPYAGDGFSLKPHQVAYPYSPPAPHIKYGVGVVVVEDGRFLATRRRDNGVIALPGGSLNFGETFYQAAVREVLEETGLVVVPVLVAGLSTNHVFATDQRITPDAHHVSFYVYAEVVGGELQNREPAKHEDWEWLSIEAAGLLKEDHWLPLGAMQMLRGEGIPL